MVTVTHPVRLTVCLLGAIIFFLIDWHYGVVWLMGTIAGSTETVK
jgi:hypothetical protein